LTASPRRTFQTGSFNPPDRFKDLRRDFRYLWQEVELVPNIASF